MAEMAEMSKTAIVAKLTRKAKMTKKAKMSNFRNLPIWPKCLEWLDWPK